LILGVLNFSAKPEQARFQDITLASKDRTLHLNGRKETNFPEVRFLSVRDRYFCAIIESGLNGYSGFIKKLNPQESAVGLVVQEAVLAPGQKAGQKFRIYLGPQDLRIIEKANPDWSVVMYHGMFDFLARMLLGALEFFYGFVHNWGLAIVILGLAIYLVLFPLTLKQMRSMKQMQALQPRMEELRKVYKDNPQKLNKEMLELYREHKVNPLGGCLPLILQMPIFIALYQALIRSINLKGAHFLWIQDLSEPDQLFVLPKALPVLGNQINLLPILIAVMMFIQQKISTVSAPSQSKEQQRLMLILFPLMFGFIFYRFPSGLGLYWFINSLLMLLYQFRIRYSR
jgi:YidC/Oxa1 family membrane protein insertase